MPASRSARQSRILLRRSQKIKKVVSFKGLTLVELLLSAAILAFVLTGMVAFFVNCNLLNVYNRNLSVAMSHAQYTLEDIRNTTNLTNITAGIANGNWTWDATTVRIKGLNALNNESISSNYTDADPLHVTVTVSWRDLNSKNRNISLETLITQ